MAHPYNFSDDTYTTLLASIAKWTITTPQMNSENSDLLVYINRAQKYLENKRVLNPLVCASELTIDSITSIATIPSDYRKFIDMRSDSDSDNIYDYPYIVNTDFEFIRSFSKTTGWTISIKFHISPGKALYEPVYLIYQKALEQFTGTGTEYLFFPMELMDVTTKLLIARDSGEISNEYKAIDVMFKECYNEYLSMCNIDRHNDPYFIVPDMHGNKITLSYESVV